MRRFLIWDLVSISRCLLKTILRVSSSKSGKAFCLERRRAACIIIMSEGDARHVWANINKVGKKSEGRKNGREKVADGWNWSARVKSMRGKYRVDLLL